MSDERKIITEIKVEERRQERAENRRVFFQRLVGIFKFLLVMTIFAYAFIHRVQIEKFSRAAIDRVMNHVTLSPQTRQKAADYQNQIDGVTTN